MLPVVHWKEYDSNGGNVATPTCSCLKPEKVDKLVIFAQNLQPTYTLLVF